MSHQPDGPLAGAPLSFPRSSCAPVIGPFIDITIDTDPPTRVPDVGQFVGTGAQVPFVLFDNGATTVQVDIQILKMDDPEGSGGAKVELVAVTGSALPPMTIQSLSFAANPSPDYSTLTVIFDTNSPDPDTEASLVITNNAGCCAQMLVAIEPAT